jgi:hypothetical protein
VHEPRQVDGERHPVRPRPAIGCLKVVLLVPHGDTTVRAREGGSASVSGVGDDRDNAGGLLKAGCAPTARRARGRSERSRVASVHRPPRHI